MKIYKVERTDGWSYDDYDSFVCFANSEDEARRVHPCGDDMYELHEDGWRMRFSDGCLEEKASKYHSWTHDVSSLKVWELNRDPSEGKPTVILASYHAG